MQIEVVPVNTEIYYLSVNQGGFAKGRIKARKLLENNKIEYCIAFPDPTSKNRELYENLTVPVFEKYERMFYYYKNKFLKEHP